MQQIEKTSSQPTVGRPRKQNTDLPLNLYFRRERGTFRYRNPQTGEFHPLGRDRRAAIEAATRLNAILLPANDLVAGVIGAGKTVAFAAEHYRQTIGLEKAKKMAAESSRVMQLELLRIEQGMGQQSLAQLEVKHCAEFLGKCSKGRQMRNKIRARLIDVLDLAIAEGWIDSNPATYTRKVETDRQRAAMSDRDFRLIRQCAPPYMQQAMDLARATLLRVSDLTALRWDQITDGVLTIPIQKSTRFKNGERQPRTILQLVLTDHLQQVLATCRSNIASPYIIHRMPKRIPPRKQWPAWRKHHTQVSVPQIDKDFDIARAAAVREHGLSWPGTPPTWHCIRALGGADMREAGVPNQVIQKLYGHTTERMTRVYLDQHDAPASRIELPQSGA